MKTTKSNTKGQCIREVANYSKQVPSDKFDKRQFNSSSFAEKMPETSPKLAELIRTIHSIDQADMEKHNKLFKHIIYTDIKKAAAGSKMIAAGLTASGFNNVYQSDLKIDIKTGNTSNNFALLCSVSIYDKPFPVKLKKSILSTFNSRPDNIHGELIRFLILDQGFKEGIDVFDVKYVHLFEPLITSADEKQAVGRGTRYCGQKGLVFDPSTGWPLHVIKYDVTLDDVNKKIYNVDTMHELFMINSGLDISKLNFAGELESISKYGAVDYELTKKVHRGNMKFGTIDDEISSALSVRTTVANLMSSDTASTSASASDSHIYTKYRKLEDKPFNLAKKVSKIRLNSISPKHIGGGIKGKKKKGMNVYLARASRKQKTFPEMRKYVRERFLQTHGWNDMKFENKCEQSEEAPHEIGNQIGNQIVKYTPTQEFVSRYFDHTSANKGMLLWHSVGTGKTCSAIAVASSGFEAHGYTILWVTRHTLKSDIWKNMFEKVCSVLIKRRMEKGEKFPANAVKKPLQYVGNQWITPISYKQFTNMLAEKNDIFKTLKKRNGAEDPLRKTLVIIDEVHKLYSSDLPAQERPNLKVLKEKIKKSYKVSGKDSVRLLLMSATPYTSDPMDLIKIINLLRQEDMPEDFEAFKKAYLDDHSKFTTSGARIYLDNIAGYISFLNREKDARQFAYPVYYHINVPMSLKDNAGMQALVTELEEIQGSLANLEAQPKKGKSKEEKEQLKASIKDLKTKQKEIKKLITKEKNKEDYSQESALENCMKK